MVSAAAAVSASPTRSTGPRLGREAVRTRFPPRPIDATWSTTQCDRETAIRWATVAPFVISNPVVQAKRVRGLRHLLDWLAGQPGDTWQQRWTSSGAETLGPRWRQKPVAWLAEQGLRSAWLPSELSSALLALIFADVVRPALRWLVCVPSIKSELADGLALERDPGGFGRLREHCRTHSGITKQAARLTAQRAAVIVAAKGGTLADITVGDVLELVDTETETLAAWPRAVPVFYQVLRDLELLGEQAPLRFRQLRTGGQLTPEQLVDRYGLQCRPIRDLLVVYLHERQPSLDYNSLRDLAYYLARRFWRDLEVHHPGIDSLRLAPEVAAAWRERLLTKPPPGSDAGEPIPRISYRECLVKVRAFYLDLSQWALEDPARWAPWVAPCPVGRDDVEHRKAKRRHKARMDARTRERLPVLPVLVATVEQRRLASAELLAVAQRTEPGQSFTVAGQHLTRLRPWAGKLLVADTADHRRDLRREEEYAFWAWAAVNVLRLTGIRIEELMEATHHSLIQYRLPTTGELVPLLQIAPSKTDAERLLVVSPELADVLSAIIVRVRDETGTVPLVPAYDWHECIWRPPAPVLFQRRFGTENRAISHGTIRKMIQAALADTGLTDPVDGGPLNYTPHDFRRLFITDAILNGLPPHIAQVIAGHRDINVTMGYKAIYPEESIQAHLAFLARRRSLRPSEEYRVPTDEEWAEFLGHFERRKVSTGICARAYSTPCVHEHACLRCPMHWPDPAQRPRIVDIRDNLIARITEAEREGWLGEVEGLRISLAGANDKLTQIDRRRAPAVVDLPTPTIRREN
ncbi:site-specific integrase [Nonomuraea guangzhouensis]|uniref:Tyrosine-type recombinase/integrase n=1 Tax=Nonomuraea guangzhouensis TaxID=1291555 RepID=A0ABW4GZE7_9ACTN|nr:site-specific integrase [Nonomuraea guangzhouensis]